MHFRTVEVDGDDADWGGVDSHLFITRYREQRGINVDINGTTFVPGNATLQAGDALGWTNNDISTQGNSKKHQIAFDVGAPITWTGDPIDYGESDYLIVEDVANYSYHTSRVDFIYPDGNVSVLPRTWYNYSYGVMFANTPDTLYIGITLENVSDDSSEVLYLKAIDVIFDDYGDGAIEGENAFRIEKDGSDYDAIDMYYDGGFLDEDVDDGETSDIDMAYDHDIPEVDDAMDYLGDFFFEVAIPIDTISARDLGASPGMQLGIEIIIRLSDSDQDAAGSTLGVASHFQGGGYPIISTHHIENIDELDLDPDDFVIIDIRGGTFDDIFWAIIEEIWIWILTTIASISAMIFGGTVLRKRRCKNGKGKNCSLL
jgi:hypothetical protein